MCVVYAFCVPAGILYCCKGIRQEMYRILKRLGEITRHAIIIEHNSGFDRIHPPKTPCSPALAHII